MAHQCKQSPNVSLTKNVECNQHFWTIEKKVVTRLENPPHKIQAGTRHSPVKSLGYIFNPAYTLQARKGL